MKTCAEHNVKFSEKSPNKGGYYWHSINFDKNEYCSKTKEAYDAIADLGEEIKPEQPGLTRESIKEPDWDAIAEGKVRHGIAVAFIAMGTPLDDVRKAEMQRWVDWILTGK